MQGSETCLNFSHIVHTFFMLCQTCEPFVAQYCQNWMLAELVVVLGSVFKVLVSNPSGGKLLLVSFALLFHNTRGVLPPNYSQWGLLNQVLVCDCGWRA